MSLGTIALGATVAALTALLVAVASGGTSREPPPGPRVLGTFEKPAGPDTRPGCLVTPLELLLTAGLAAIGGLGCNRGYAGRRIRGGGVSCRWRGSSIFVHAVVRSRYRTKRVKLLLGPRVVVRGERTLSTENDVGLTLDPGDRIVLDLVAEPPAGLPAGSAIDACSVSVTEAFVVSHAA